MGSIYSLPGYGGIEWKVNLMTWFSHFMINEEVLAEGVRAIQKQNTECRAEKEPEKFSHRVV